MGLTRYRSDVNQHPGFSGHDIQLGWAAGRGLDNRRCETGPTQMFIPPQLFCGLKFQVLQAIYQFCHCRGGVQTR